MTSRDVCRICCIKQFRLRSGLVLHLRVVFAMPPLRPLRTVYAMTTDSLAMPHSAIG